MTRYFYFWCERCPTRITIATEVPASAPDGEPEYNGGSYVAVASTCDVADLCPACAGQLHDLDTLVAHNEVKLTITDAREEHAAWRARRIGKR